MPKLLLCVVIVLLQACTPLTNKNTILKDPNHNFDTVTITWIVKERKDFEYKTVDPRKVVGGYAMYVEGKPECTIVAPEPKSMRDKKAIEVVFHEVYHCFRGQFHKHEPLKKIK